VIPEPNIAVLVGGGELHSIIGKHHRADASVVARERPHSPFAGLQMRSSPGSCSA
jgi:hypothetical protein